jgi:thiol-disulfide isomerase/thioredoxin
MTLTLAPKPASSRSYRPSAAVFTLFLAVITATWQTAIAQDQPPATPADAPASDAAQAWRDLRVASQNKLQAATDPEQAVDAILADLLAFADRFPKTDEAAIALLNHGSLAAQLNRFEEGEKSLQRALDTTQDPELIQAVKMQLRQMAIRPGKTPPPFFATTLAGEKISPADHAGKVVLLDFWATWCGPCIAELPNVQRVYAEHHKDGFEIISISLDQDEQALRDFVKEREMTWTHVFNPAQPPDQDVAEIYSVSSIPTMILVGRDGKIAAVGLRGGSLGEAVVAALAIQAPQAPASPNQEGD